MRAQPLFGAAPPGPCARTTVAATTADNSTKARIALAADRTLNWRRKLKLAKCRKIKSFEG